MTSLTIRVIREEHAALAAMLRSILLLIEQHRREATQPDFATLRAMLFYVDEFPEQRHHRKESTLLFPKLRARKTMRRRQRAHLDGSYSCCMRAPRPIFTPPLPRCVNDTPARCSSGATRSSPLGVNRSSRWQYGTPSQRCIPTANSRQKAG